MTCISCDTEWEIIRLCVKLSWNWFKPLNTCWWADIFMLSNGLAGMRCYYITWLYMLNSFRCTSILSVHHSLFLCYPVTSIIVFIYLFFSSALEMEKKTWHHWSLCELLSSITWYCKFVFFLSERKTEIPYCSKLITFSFHRLELSIFFSVRPLKKICMDFTVTMKFSMKDERSWELFAHRQSRSCLLT